MTNNQYISDLTGLSVNALETIQENNLLVVSHQIKNQIDSNSLKEIELDKYGKIKIDLSSNEKDFELVFVPSEQLLSTLRYTIKNNKSMLIEKVESTIVKKIKEKYDSLV